MAITWYLLSLKSWENLREICATTSGLSQKRMIVAILWGDPKKVLYDSIIFEQTVTFYDRDRERLQELAGSDDKEIMLATLERLIQEELDRLNLGGTPHGADLLQSSGRHG